MLLSASQNDDRDQYQHGTSDPEVDAFADYDESRRLHLATVEQKKRLWRRNAFITSGFIGLW
jgi:hypothetical protein